MVVAKLPKARVPLEPTSDGLAFVATVKVNSTPLALLLDTGSAAGVTLACTSLVSDGGNASACLDKARPYYLCPPNSTSAYSPLWTSSLCVAEARLPVQVQLGNLTLPSVPASVLTSDTSLVFHGADGALGLAVRSTYTSRNANFTDQIQSYSLNLAAQKPYLIVNDVDPEATSANGWTALRQKASYLNESTIALRGFSESVDEGFVNARFTQPASAATATKNAWLDAAWPSITFPQFEFDAFYDKYLRTCTPHNGTSSYETPRYYHCSRTITLPRLAFTTTNGTFFLDRADYVRPDPEDARRAIVLVQNYTYPKYWSIEWGLGLPFVRKFPAFFNGTGREHEITLFCKPGASCDVSKWSVNDSRDDTPAPYPSRSSTSSSGTQTRYWTLGITIPLLILIILYTGRRHFRQYKIDRERRRMRNEADEQEPPSSAAKTSEEAQTGAARTPTVTAPYSLLSGPATLTVTTTSDGNVTGMTGVPPPATGVTARWRNDLADLETRV